MDRVVDPRRIRQQCLARPGARWRVVSGTGTTTVTRAELIAGIVWRTIIGWPGRPFDLEQVTDALVSQLDPSTVWQSAHLPPDLHGQTAWGRELPRWQQPDDLDPDEAALFESAWLGAWPAQEPDRPTFLRLRADGIDDLRRLRELGEVDGTMIVPSLDSRGSRSRPLVWRWPFRVGVLADPGGWLDHVRGSYHHGLVYDAEPYDPAHAYDIAIVPADVLAGLPDDVVGPLGDVTCVIAVGTSVDDALVAVEDRIAPSISIAIEAPPDVWCQPLFWELSHDLPIDVAVEMTSRSVGCDALLTGPGWGLDVTAAARWFAAAAPDHPELVPLLDEYVGWDWRSEGGGASNESAAVRSVRDAGADPVVVVPPPVMAEAGDGRGAGPDEPVDGDDVGPEVLVEEEHADTPSAQRELVVRVWKGQDQVETILPPTSDLVIGVRVAIPERGDTATGVGVPLPPVAPAPTIQLEVVAESDAWEVQPDPQPISLSLAEPALPSSWARFSLTTPAAGIVEIRITILYRGKPLQAATFVSPVNALALPGETPTLTVFNVSGPDEPLEEDTPTVDATLDGRGAELRHLRGGDARILITDVDDMLRRIEDLVSRVLGVEGAPDSFADPRAVDLIVELARLGSELHTLVAPLRLEGARRINLVVNAESRVLPLELVYAGRAPKPGAKLCKHVTSPPPGGAACDRTSTRTVCPYAFWGLHRSISRTIVSTGGPRGTDPRPFHPSTVLYAATDIADRGATTDPTPSRSVRDVAAELYPAVHQVRGWREWRSKVRHEHPELLVVLGHTATEAGETKLYIGRRSVLARPDISADELRAPDSPAPVVLLVACATAALGDAFGSLPGVMTARGAGAVVGTLSKIVGPHGAVTAAHLLRALRRTDTIGDAITVARRSLVAEQRPIGLILVSHGETDTKIVA
jgi:hypothetical protein